MSTLPAFGLRPTPACFRPAAAAALAMLVPPGLPGTGAAQERRPDPNPDNNVWEANP